MINQIASKIDERLLELNGKVFYSGRSAFENEGGIYVVGFNPGGDPATHKNETIGAHTKYVLTAAPAEWSAYRDETWQGNGPNLQRRMMHLFAVLEIDPRRVASSNLIFIRSRRSGDLGLDRSGLIEMCWPVHAAVFQLLFPKAVVCLGTECAEVVRKRIGAHEQVGSFVEKNHRRWSSLAWRSPQGTIVVRLTHPSVADWTNADTDPSQMVKHVLQLC